MLEKVYKYKVIITIILVKIHPQYFFIIFFYKRKTNIFTIITAVACDKTIILFYEANYVITIILFIT